MGTTSGDGDWQVGPTTRAARSVPTGILVAGVAAIIALA